MCNTTGSQSPTGSMESTTIIKVQRNKTEVAQLYEFYSLFIYGVSESNETTV